jgi:pimeloyl-ACP methyl ester carboxylesterase
MRRLWWILALAAAAWLADAVVAADEPVVDQAQQARALWQAVSDSFASKDYTTAEQKGAELAKLLPHAAPVWYNLACAQARLGRTAAALDSLTKAVAAGFDDAQHIQEDPDLESLRGEEAFKALVKQVGDKEAATLGAPGAPIAGVKTIERRAAKGFHYRVRISPDATAEKPQRLVVWLHPAGGAANEAAEALTLMLNQAGFALLVVKKKQYLGWSEAEGSQLLATLADAADIPGVDAKRPLLLGFSAGGQMALLLWVTALDRFGGLILDAAYPIDTGAMAQGKVLAMSLPDSPALKQTPIYAVVGDQDGGAAIWRQLQPGWQQRGIPLTVRFVAGRRHEWLLTGAEVPPLEQWLKDVAAGQLPGAPNPPAAAPAAR